MSPTIPTIDLFGKKVSRVICGGNPLSGFSHVTSELDWEMIRYYTMPNIQALLNDCWKNGINTFQTRGDRLMMRVFLEHRETGGKMNWIAQTASEFSSIPANIGEIVSYKPIAIYHHGTHTDNSWHSGQIDAVRDVIDAIHDHGLPAGIGTHIPEVIEYMEEKGWPVDFYMGCFYNLARGYKSAPATDQDAYVKERYPDGDPAVMAKVLRQTEKPCLAFKILAASRKCTNEDSLRAAYRFAFENIKPTDGVVVGLYQKHKNQALETAAIVRGLLQT